MFGYLIPSQADLSKELKTEYRKRYCGLCRAIGARYGNILRSALSYEMTFLVLVLDSVAGAEAPELPRCVKHPFREKGASVPPNQAYAADLTVLLLSAKLDDDIADENSRLAKMLSKRLSSKAEQASAARPIQAEQIKTALSALSQMEKQNELRPDLPAGCFGSLVGRLFEGCGEEPKAELYRLGFALGKLLYLMDAADDLTSDLKHERYNPLVCTSSQQRQTALEVLLGDVMDAIDRLPETELSPLIRNIAESGFQTHLRKQKSKREGTA